MMGVWDDLKKRVKIVRAETRYGNILEDGMVWKPDPKDLDGFEKGKKFKFPDDFREFVYTFGPGNFGGEGWCFYAPGIPENHWDGEPNGLDIQYLYAYWINTQFSESNQKLILFCSKGVLGMGESFFGWNPEDVSDPDRHEYGIYMTRGDFGRRKERKKLPVKVASTFREFVMSYAFGGDLGPQEEGVGTNDHSEQSRPGLIPYRQSRV